MGNQRRSPKLPAKRPYVLKARADKRAQMHGKLARAAFELHDTIGPSRTTITAIAQHAGVQRLTVYRHFPDDAAIFAACTAYSFEVDPPPNPEAWAAIENPERRLPAALGELYGYYQRKRRLLANLYRDAEMPVVAAALRHRKTVLAQGADVLARGWTVPRRNDRIFRATLGHILQFATWLSLIEDYGLDGDDVICLAVHYVKATGAASGSREKE